MNAQLRSTLFLLLVFLCGVVAGGITDHWWLHRTARARANWTETRTHLMEEVKQELDLSPDQCRQMETILDEAMRDFQNLHSQAHQVRLDTNERLRAILNDQQKQKFGRALTRMQKNFEASQ